MTMAILRFNFAAPHDDPAARRDRINAALELGSWSETRGVSAVSIDEHHQSGHGWSCNPIMTAAVFLARTERVVASVDCASRRCGIRSDSPRTLPWPTPSAPVG